MCIWHCSVATPFSAGKGWLGLDHRHPWDSGAWQLSVSSSSVQKARAHGVGRRLLEAALVQGALLAAGLGSGSCATPRVQRLYGKVELEASMGTQRTSYWDGAGEWQSAAEQWRMARTGVSGAVFRLGAHTHLFWLRCQRGVDGIGRRSRPWTSWRTVAESGLVLAGRSTGERRACRAGEGEHLLAERRGYPPCPAGGRRVAASRSRSRAVRTRRRRAMAGDWPTAGTRLAGAQGWRSAWWWLWKRRRDGGGGNTL
ncbi:hypothetical protein V8D89_012802 [Ganoderma adspersum]